MERTGKQRTAVLLLAMGDKFTADVFKRMDRQEIADISRAIVELGADGTLGQRMAKLLLQAGALVIILSQKQYSERPILDQTGQTLLVEYSRSTDSTKIRRCPPGVFQALETPLLSTLPRVRTLMPSRRAASRVEHVREGWTLWFMAMGRSDFSHYHF